MYLGCRFYPFVYVEFSRMPIGKKWLTYIFMYHQLSNSGETIPTFAIPFFLKPLFFNSLKQYVVLLGHRGSVRPRNPIRVLIIF